MECFTRVRYWKYLDKKKLLQLKVFLGCNVRLFDIDIDSPLFKNLS